MVSAAAKQRVQSIIDENPVAVFSKSYCPHCHASKETLKELGIKPFVIELDNDVNCQELQDALQEISGQRTVPNIYIKQKHIGGNSDLQEKKAVLPQLLEEAGATKL